MVVRQYLVGNFGFDDTAMKTLGEGKKDDPSADQEWGSVKIVVYPEGTPVPAADKSAAGSSPTADGPAAQQPQPADNKQH
jgi:hypothetical protein